MQHASAPQRSFAGLVALADHRLATSGGGRVGLFGAGLVAMLSVVEIVLTPPGRDAGAAAVGAAGLLAWLGVGPALLAAAKQAGRDHADGVALLAALHGHGSRRRTVARMLGLMTLVGRRVGLVAIGLGLLGAAVAGDASGLARRLAAMALFALATGASMALLTEACAALGGRRSAALLVAVVVVPWVLAEPVGYPGCSVPASLGAVLERSAALPDAAASGALLPWRRR